MGFRFRQGIRIVKGVRLNIGKTGASLSIGGRGATVNVGKKGVKGTVGIPGTGLSYSAPLTAKNENRMVGQNTRQQGSLGGVLIFVFMVLGIWFLFIK